MVARSRLHRVALHWFMFILGLREPHHIPLFICKSSKKPCSLASRHFEPGNLKVVFPRPPPKEGEDR